MGKDIVHFKCHHCNHCCTDVICLPTPWDVKRIAKMTGNNPKDFLEFLTAEDIDGADEDDPTWLEVGDQRYLMALKRDAKTGCYFLNQKTRYCSIYEARPLLCRLYPFKVVESRSGEYKGFVLHDDVGCPRHRDGAVTTKPLYDLYIQDEVNQDDYRELVEVFNAREYPRKKPGDFIKMFMNGFQSFLQKAE